MINDNEKIARIQLLRTEGIGPVTFWSIIKLFGSALSSVDKIPELSLRGGAKTPKQVFPKELAEKEVKETIAMGGRIIFKEESEYPKILKTINDPPPFLSVIGTIDNSKPTVAIIGARAASLNAIKFTEKLSHELSDSGFNIISGFARGIDYAAHKSAKSTISVFAGGIDVIYPPENEPLYSEILKKGAILSESALHTKTHATLFPRRNRIIAGIAQSIIVVEAALKSGSLITAKFGLDYNRDIYAVPGFPEDPRCKGSNQLIKNGATLLSSADDVINNINIFNYSENIYDDSSFENEYCNEISEADLSKYRDQILSCLSSSPTFIDDIIQQIGNSGIVMTILVEYELAGKISRVSGNKVILNF